MASPIEITDNTASVVNLYNNKTVHGVEFTFEYEDKTTGFVLIASNGAVYDPKTVSNEFYVEETKEGMIVRFPQAQKGQWKLRYNTNGKIKVSISDYEPELLLNGFKAGNADIYKEETASSSGIVSGGESGNSEAAGDSAVISKDNMVNWKFSPEHEKHFWYKYKIYLSKSGKFDGSERLKSTGEGYVGHEALGSFVLDEESGKYYLLVETEYNIGGKSLTSRACSNSFTYEKNNVVAAPEDFTVEAYRDEELIRISWDEDKLPWVSTVRLTVVKDNVCIYKQNLDSIAGQAFIKVEGGEKFKVSLACVDRDLVSDELTKEFLWENPEDFKITDMDKTLRNEYTWSYSYKNAKNQRITEEIAGVSRETILSGDGKQTLELTGNPCEIKLSYEDSSGIIWKESILVYQDNISPDVELYGDYSNASTDSSTIDIKGKTEADAELTINSVNVPLNEDGSFLYSMPLSFGENALVLEVRDTAGNVSRVDGKIHMVSSLEYMADYRNSGAFALIEKYPELSALIISTIIVTLLLLTAFFFIRKWSRISAKAREELLKYPEYAEGRTIQRVRLAQHTKMLANLMLGIFLIDLFLCIFCYITGYYVSRLSQFDRSGNLLPEAFLSMYSISITVDELFVIANKLAVIGGILLIVTLLTQWFASSIRKMADSSLISEGKKLNKKLKEDVVSVKNEEKEDKAELAVRPQDKGDKK